MTIATKQPEAKPAIHPRRKPVGTVLYAAGFPPIELEARAVRLLLQGWELRQRIESLDTELKAINAKIGQEYGAGATLIITGVCRATVVERESVKVLDGERLHAVLGERFDDLVKTTIAYKAEPRLVEMASDADEPLAPAVRECLGVASSVAVAWRAEKPGV
ncbi:MAG: hypothetical protein AB1412_05375 [Pseudomonadota bacterium]